MIVEQRSATDKIVDAMQGHALGLNWISNVVQGGTAWVKLRNRMKIAGRP